MLMPGDLWCSIVLVSLLSTGGQSMAASDMVRKVRVSRAGVSIASGKWHINGQVTYPGYDRPLLKTAEGQVELVRRAKGVSPGLLVSTSGLGHGTPPESVVRASDFPLIHLNGTPLEDIPQRVAALQRYGRPIACDEDEKVGEEGAADDPIVYTKLKELTKPRQEGNQ